MKILLIAPCKKNDVRPGQFSIPQLTLPLLAAMTPEQHEVVIYEEVYGDVVDFDEVCGLVGISLMSQTSIRGYEIANEFKKRGRKVVFGGIHATALPEEALRYGDAVVIGEAENGLWATVVADAEHDRLKPFYKLDTLPDLQNGVAPRRDLIKCTSGGFDIAPIEATRGCPYNCDFCSVTRFFGKKQRHLPVRDIVADAESCRQKHLFFVDDNVTLDRRFALQLFREMKSVNKIWVGQASINLSKDPELMKAAYDSGCRALLIGFESVQEESSSSFRKTLKTMDDNVEAIRKLRDAGFLIMASVIFGLDTDTEKVFDVTLEFIHKAKPAFIQACVLTPYPGTLVFEQMKNAGRILTDDWSKYDTKKIVIEPGILSSESLQDGYNDIRKRVFHAGSILDRALPHMMMGIKETFLYFSLNIGARITYQRCEKQNIFRNREEHPVDFNPAKYVKPQNNR